MMGHLTTAFIVAVLFLNLIGLALVGFRAVGSYALSRGTTPVVAALLVFFAEHFIGFGRLDWCWPITTAASLWLVTRHLDVLRRHWKIEAAFLVGFAWAFAWRFSYPGIVASSEKLGDLAMIATYLPGSRLPPQDVWFPPFPFDVYYSFQFYAAALVGRVFGLAPGLTYNLSFCLLVALTIVCAATCAFTICRRASATALVVLAFVVGGTGATVPVHFMVGDPQLHSSMRFIGGSATHQRVQTQFGRSLVNAAHVPRTAPPELPSETFAYLTSLGDYHPQMSGFYLLAVALLCIALIERGTAERPSQIMLAASLPVTAVANGWTLPLQCALVVTWLLYRMSRRAAPDWRALAIGLFCAGALVYPFLSGFAYRAADYNVAFRPVPHAARTPPLLGLIVHFPVLLAIAIPVALGERKRWVLWASAMWLAMLVFSELIYVDDVYGGAFDRFNTTLKWWPWIQAGALVLAGAYGLASASRACRYATFALLVIVSLYGVDLVRGLVRGTKVDFGRLDGAAWITSDNIEKVLLEYLKTQPRGIVLQRLETGAFTPAPGIVIFAGQQAFLGWPEHEKLWRGQRADVERRAQDVKRFYAGEMADSAEWLVQNRIDHVLWLKAEYKLPPGTFDKIDAQIRSAYYWREYYRAGDFRVGLWSRKRP
jgi:uncharacterized membrane protein